MSALLPATQAFLKRSPTLLINGKWVPSSSGKVFDTFNPATGKVIAHAAHGDARDVDLAVKSARSAFESGPWKTMSPSDRGRILHRVGDLILKNQDELAQLEALDNGKPFTVAKVADVALAADLFHYMSGYATKIHGRTFDISVPYAPGAVFNAYTRREAIGVCGQIIPWNFPLLMAAWKLGPALTCGNTVVLKPAEQTPLTSLRLGELLLEAGVPAGVVNIVTGFGDAGAAIAAHHGVDKVAFTGSTEVGKLVMQAAGTTNLKKVTLELGGKSPNIIFADSALTPGGLDRAIQAAAMGVFFNQGQVCCAGSRVFIEQSVFDQVLEGIAKKARSVKVGDAFDPATEMGPLVSTEQHDRVRGYIHQGRKDGAHIVTGGTEHPDGVAPGGYFVRPTVITKTRPTMSVVAEEIFGPVIVAEPFTDIDDVIRQANNTVYGLAAGLHTSNISKANKVTAALKAGTVWVNTFNIFDAALPFGGYKQSGIGREMGPESLESYLETKSVVVAN